MHKLRLRYVKTGTAKYISHLDLMSTMKRALLRAGVSLKYSDGFNPHPYMSGALPLPVGSASICELLDFGAADELPPDILPEIINAVLPEGLEILEAYVPGSKFSGIKWIGLNGSLFYRVCDPAIIVDKLTEAFSAESIIITKRTKRGTSELDIVPFIRDVGFEMDNSCLERTRDVGVSGPGTSDSERNFLSADAADAADACGFPVEKLIRMSVKVSAQDPSITPDNLLGALNLTDCGLIPDFAAFTRTEVYDENMKTFR